MFVKEREVKIYDRLGPYFYVAKDQTARIE